MIGLAWPQAKRVAVALNVLFEAYADDKAPLLGPMGNPLAPGTRDSQGISWVQYAVKRGIYRVLRVLGRNGLRASIFTSGILAERYPDIVRAAAGEGHEICGHGYTQDLVPAYQSADDERETIRRCTEVLADAIGEAPVGWISPRATPSANTLRLLAEAGYKHHGDCFDDDLPYLQRVSGRSIVAIPLSMDVNDLPTLIRYGNPPLAILTTFEDSLAQMSESGEASMIDVTMHAHVAGRPYVVSIYDRIMHLVARRPDVWVATRLQIAEHILGLEAREHIAGA